MFLVLFRCIKDLANECDTNNGGCWSKEYTVNGKKKTFSACQDNIDQYKVIIVMNACLPALHLLLPVVGSTVRPLLCVHNEASMSEHKHLLYLHSRSYAFSSMPCAIQMSRWDVSSLSAARLTIWPAVVVLSTAIDGVPSCCHMCISKLLAKAMSDPDNQLLLCTDRKCKSFLCFQHLLMCMSKKC